MGREMNTDGLGILCTGLGIADEDDDGNARGYTKTEYCLDNLKDLQRFLRRDEHRDVFKQICRWNTVSRDLVPIIEHYQSDTNLVINVVKILVFLTMPVDPSSEEVALQIEYLWDLKAALTRNVMLAVIVSLLEEPLGHLESGEFTEDDWKLAQLVLTLFRNILAIQGITLQQKASGCATQFFHLTERMLELMFQENIMDLILVLAQHVDDPDGYLRHDNLLILEIFYYILLGQDPELVAKSSTIGSKVSADKASADSLRLIIEEEDKKKREIRQKNLDCHPQFSGAFTRIAMDGSKKLFKDPASASSNGLAKVRKVQRGPLKKVASDNGVLTLQENIIELLHSFLNQFLASGYNGLMRTIRDDIIKEHHDLQNSDIITFFQVAYFITSFHQKRILTKGQNMDDMTNKSSVDSSLDYFSLHPDLCGPIAATMNEAMFSLVISKWREALDGVKMTNNYKFLTAAGSLMKSMVRILDLLLKMLPEESKECQTARVLLYKLFYDQTNEGLTQFLLNQFKCFDSHKQPRSDLADLLEIIHIMLRLMEKLQAHGTLRVSKKARRRKMKNKSPKNEIQVESDLLEKPEIANENVEYASEMCLDLPVNEKLSELNSVEREQGFNHDDSLNFGPEVALDKSLQNLENLHDQDDKENRKQDDQNYETSSSSNTEEPATNEVDFNISALVSSFASATVAHNLCWLLKHYKANSASTNHYILCMLKRLCVDLELSPMLYQLSLLTMFYDILAEQKRCKSREYMNIVDFLNKFIRKMFNMMKRQPLLFVEILFWKTRRECQCINAEVLMKNIQSLRKDVKNMVDDSTAESNNHIDIGYRSIADALGEDEIDLDLPQIHHEQSEIPPSPKAQGSSSRDNSPNFAHEQDATIKELYAKYKNERQCNHLIAEALDPDGKISSTFISRKLKQLGLKVVSKKKLVKANMPVSENNYPTVSGSDINTAQDVLDNSENTLTKNLRGKRKLSFSSEEELQIKILYEKFKNHKKRNIMIANTLNSEKKFTTAQVSRKLKQLGLLLHSKTPSTSGKDMEGSEINEVKDISDDENLLAFRERSSRKKRVIGRHATAVSTSPHKKETVEENGDDDVVLSSFKDAGAKRKKKHYEEDGRDAAYSESPFMNDIAIENSRGEHEPINELSALNQNDEVEKQSELEDLLDSGEDVVPIAPRNVRSRKIILDFEDEEDD